MIDRNLFSNKLFWTSLHLLCQLMVLACGGSKTSLARYGGRCMGQPSAASSKFFWEDSLDCGRETDEIFCLSLPLSPCDGENNT